MRGIADLGLGIIILAMILGQFALTCNSNHSNILAKPLEIAGSIG